MSVLKWDETGTRLFETGVDHGVLFVSKDVVEENDNSRYEPGVVWNGLTAVTNSPEGAEPTDLWADNIKYATLRSAETFGATIEAYQHPEEFEVCDGSASPVPGVHIRQQSRKSFAFCYRTKVGSDIDTDASKYKIHIIYNATCSPSESSFETINDSPDAVTFSWEITTSPVNVSGFKPTSEVTIDVWKLSDFNKARLEGALYGTDDSESYLPDPDGLLALYVDFGYSIDENGHLILVTEDEDTDVSMEIDEYGHLIYTHDEYSDVDFSLDENGHLIMEVA